MEIKKLVGLFTALFLLVGGSNAHAGTYIFGGGGIMTHQYSNVSNPSAFKIGAGYMAPSNFGFEGSYMNLGDGAIGGGDTLTMSGLNFSGIFEMPLRPLVMSFKAGMYSIDAKTTTWGSATSTGFSWGILLGYEPNERVTIFMDTEGFANVNATGPNTETPTLITFGVKYRL